MVNNDFDKPKVVFRTAEFLLIAYDFIEDNCEKRRLCIVKDDVESEVGIYSTKVNNDVWEWAHYTDNSVVIFSRKNSICYGYPADVLNKPTIKIFFYIPTLTKIKGSQEQLMEVYKMLFPKTKDKVQEINLDLVKVLK